MRQLKELLISIVIIPQKGADERLFIEETLTSLCSQVSSEISLEILFVSSSTKLAKIEVKGMESLRLIECPEAMPGWKKKNLAIEASQGEFILFIERPIRVEPGYLRKIITNFEIDKVAAIQGRSLEMGDDSNSAYPRVAGFARLYRVPYLDGSGVIIRRSVLNSLSSFNPFYAGFEWIDLSWRLLFTDCIIAYQRDAVAYEMMKSNDLEEGFWRGWECAAFVFHWREVLFVRVRMIRIAYRAFQRFIRCFQGFIEIRSLIKPWEFFVFLKSKSLFLLGFISGLPSALLIPRTRKFNPYSNRSLCWKDKRNMAKTSKRIPTTFFYLHNEFIFADRVGIIDPPFFRGAQKDFLIAWLDGKTDPEILIKEYDEKTTLQPDSSEEALRKMANRMIQKSILEKAWNSK